MWRGSAYSEPRSAPPPPSPTFIFSSFTPNARGLRRDFIPFRNLASNFLAHRDRPSAALQPGFARTRPARERLRHDARPPQQERREREQRDEEADEHGLG